MPAPMESACGSNRDQEGARADGEWDGRQHSHTSAMMISASVECPRICRFYIVSIFFDRGVEHVL